MILIRVAGEWQFQRWQNVFCRYECARKSRFN